VTAARRSHLASWYALGVAALGALYVVVVAGGFVAAGTLSVPLPDPWLALAEVLILLLAPLLVLLASLLVVAAAPDRRVWGLAAFGWTCGAMTVTVTVHLTELTVGRSGSVSGGQVLYGFRWPALLYAADVAAWDLLLGMALLSAAAALAGRRFRRVRAGLVLAGGLCLVGLVGPALGDLAWRGLGIAGYAVVLPLTCLELARTLRTTGSSDAASPPRPPARRG
jgi:hypothetical protein